MLVKAELGEDAVEARGGGFGHTGIVKQGMCWSPCKGEGDEKNGNCHSGRKSWQKLLVGPAVVLSYKGSFDSVVASLRETTTPLRMTAKEDRRYSYRSASMGLSLAALIAGNMPLMMPTKLRMAVDQIRVAESM